MAGKPYSIKEMKSIVDYLVEHKAYGDIKGRKKWIELASSKITSRTWQSLKETFLKRILPDIHNPYYKLTFAQISSFREGCDIERKSQNKLELRTLSDGSSSIVDKQEKNEANPSKSANGDTSSGETKQSAKVPTHSRSSVETLVLDKEDRNDLHGDSDVADRLSTKSIRDCIIYSEPLTPMMQQIMTDFASEDENKLQIVEGNINSEEKDAEKVADSNQSEEITQSPTKINKNRSPGSKINGSNVSKSKKLQENHSEKEEKSSTKKNTLPSPKKLSMRRSKAKNDLTESMELAKDIQSLPNTNTSTDTTIPNNQESLAQNKLKQRESNEQLAGVSNNIGDKSTQKHSASPNSESYKTNKQMKSDEPVGIAESNTIASNTNQDNEVIENPCLKSVSLYAEQFTPNNYLISASSESDVIPVVVSETTGQEIIAHNNIDVSKSEVILKSSSESCKDMQQVPIKQQIDKKRRPLSKTKNRMLANVFGFSSGGVSKKHRHSVYHKSPPYYRRAFEYSSASSEWTSESDCEYISPPRTSKSKHQNKYLKPKSARVLSLEEEGGLFVMYGKKIFPIVKDGKVVKNYVNYLPEEEPEEQEDSYWRAKYIEEKKKSFELTKMLNDKEANQIVPEKIHVAPTQERKSGIPRVQDKPEDHIGILNNKGPEESKESITNQKQTNKTVKIRFTKRDEEVQLEGHWSQLEPVLQQVVGILHKDNESSERGIASINNNKTGNRKTSNVSTSTVLEVLSRSTTPDEAVQRKVEELEKNIFKKIEEIHEAETSMENVNVTKRKLGLKRPLTEVSKSKYPLKVAKTSNDSDKNTEETKNELEQPNEVTSDENNVSQNDSNVSLKRKSSRKTEKKTYTPQKTKDAVPTPRKKRNVKQTKMVKKAFDDKNDEDENEVLYRFPSPVSSNKKSNKIITSNKNRYNLNLRSQVPSPDNSSRHSIESSQGYQDSDNSVQLYRIKRKRRHSSSSLTSVNTSRNKFKRNRVKSNSHLIVETSSDSSNLSFNIRKPIVHESSENSDVHRSESYQLLLPRKRTAKHLESIDEMKPFADQNPSKSDTSIGNSIIVTVHNEGPNSSNVSLPMSPELSIVENISINKSMLGNLENETSLNVTQDMPQASDKFTIPNADTSMPLADDFTKQDESSTISDFTHKTKSSLIKDCSVVITKMPSPPDGLHKRLRDLLLDSAKKILNHVSDNIMEVDSTKIKTEKKKPKKRSSTPRKRTLKGKTATTKTMEPVIDEIVQYCQNAGRTSCPPIIVSHCEDEAKENKNKKQQPKKKLVKSPKKKSKKNIIRVKIQRPKSKSPREPKNKNCTPEVRSCRTTQNETEESGVFLQGSDSVDLIHNHSETCLRNECVDSGSVDIISSADSPIFINADSIKSDEFYETFSESTNLAPEMFCNNAQDETRFKRSKSSELDSQKTNLTCVTPNASKGSSLITEDLSPEILPPKTSKWYLFSDDETTNTNMPTQKANNGSAGLTGNLKQLFFPIIAVPDLSTISELSKENDSRKAILHGNGDTRNDSLNTNF